MVTRYEVTQYSLLGHRHSKIYRSKLWAKLIAWVMTGSSLSGLDHYRCVVNEVELPSHTKAPLR